MASGLIQVFEGPTSKANVTYLKKTFVVKLSLSLSLSLSHTLSLSQLLLNQFGTRCFKTLKVN